ncbi:hypothetical protein [Arsukibacterium sp.]|uniref:hypothetical protein n=1 Tax=Arsukibacterium sp. TaxID=1977258 RepID=UPI001BD609C5|nr:hypothetical protein [Arsukibacterium sp.]
MTDRNQAEWLLVQQSYDKQEQQAIWLKAVTILVWLWLLKNTAGLELLLGVIGLFWLHEALLKTWQQRAANRLLQLEQAILQAQDIGCQWHSQWQYQRQNPLQLLLSYAKQALKPTVAVTYLALIAASLLRLWL